MAGGRAVASGAPESVRLAEVWGVDAALERGADGRLALRVDWLASAAEAAR